MLAVSDRHAINVEYDRNVDCVTITQKAHGETDMILIEVDDVVRVILALLEAIRDSQTPDEGAQSGV